MNDVNPLRTPEDYELFLYTLSERFPSIRRSTNLPFLIEEIEWLLDDPA